MIEDRSKTNRADGRRSQRSLRLRWSVRLAVLVLAGLAASGCQHFKGFVTPAPRVLPPSPGLEQVIQAVNQNSLRIQSFSTSSATISGPGWPSLRASIAFQRPRLFRLRAETGLTGPEVDLGSNNELFWFWVRRDQPPAIYYCRHDQFLTSRARQTIPIEPNWLLDSFGIMGIDPSLPHQGPYPAPGNRLQIRTITETPEGPTTKITLIDATSAWVMEQHIYDAQGHLRASSVAEAYRRDPLSGLFMPSAIRVTCPAAQFTMRIDLGKVQINQPLGDPAELWAMPTYQGSQPMNLGDPGLPQPAAMPPAMPMRQSERRLRSMMR